MPATADATADANATHAAGLPRANARPASGPGAFPIDQYVTVPDLAVFAEHEITTREGRRLRFDRRALEQIAARCNRRISETGDYAAVIVGHTSESPDTGRPIPEAIGMAGPFRVGLLGDGSRARYCILADFHIRRDKVDLYNAHPRRSVELWAADNPSEMYFDPIGLSGGETPRLDLGLAPPIRQGDKHLVDARGSDGAFSHQYTASTRGADGRLRLRYTAAGPSAGNVYIPTSAGDSERYAAAPGDASGDPPPQITDGGTAPAMMTPEDIRQVVDAFESLDFVQAWKQFMPMLPQVQQLVETEAAEHAAITEATAEPNVDGMPPDASPGMPPDAPPAAPPDAATGEATPDVAPSSTEAPPVAAGDDDPDRYTADPDAPPADDTGTVGNGDTVSASDTPAGSDGEPTKKLDDMSEEEIEQYLCDRRKRYTAESTTEPAEPEPAADQPPPADDAAKLTYTKMQRRLDALEREREARIDSERKAKLTNLRYHRAFDLSKEVERCRYARMNDEQFGEHCRIIADNFTPTLVNQPMPVPDELADGAMPTAAVRPRPERYTKDAADQAVRYVVEQAQLGKSASYERALENIVNGRPVDFAAG
jgi:hypothetical protein